MTKPSFRILRYKYYVDSGIGVAAVNSLMGVNEEVLDKIKPTQIQIIYH
jgi:hypothetical protein